MFSDDCNWDTPKSIKALNEAIFKVPAERHTLIKKKRSRLDLHAKKQSDVYISGDTKINNSVRPFKVQKASFAASAVLSRGRHNPRENNVSEKCCNVEFVKKKKHKNKQSQSAAAAADDDDDGETCHAITLDHCSSSAVMKPDVRLKSTKCVKNAKSSLKSGCNNGVSNSLSSSIVSDNVCEALSQDNSVHGKRRKKNVIVQKLIPL